MVARFAEVIESQPALVAEARYVPNLDALCIPFRSELVRRVAYAAQTIAISRVSFRVADNPGVDSATSGSSQVDYGAENGAGKRWV